MMTTSKAKPTAWLAFFFSSTRRHTRLTCDWSSDVCSSDLHNLGVERVGVVPNLRVGDGGAVGAVEGGVEGHLVARGRGDGLGAAGGHRHGRERERSEERRVGKECTPRG